MNIALISLNPIIGDIEGNTKKIIDHIQKTDADLLVFAELCISGYPPKDLLYDKEFLLANKKALLHIIESCGSKNVIIGCIDTEGSKVYNAATIISNGQFVGMQYKTLLAHDDVFYDQRYFSEATTHHVFDLGVRVGVLICEDLWDTHYETKPSDILIEKGAELLICINASPYRQGINRIRHDLLKKKAVSYNKPILYVNQVGAHDDLIFDGQSLAYNKEGSCILQGESFAENTSIISFDSPPVSVKENELAGIHHALVLGIRDYFKKTGQTTALIGLSGGVDSALVCALAVEALGPSNVIGVSMPSPYSSEGSIKDAKKLADNLGVELLDIPISDQFDLLKRSVQGISDKSSGLAEQNMQARIRGLILMSIANKKNALVLATGNKSELAVGYCTLYGDMCGALAPISDLYKTQVYELCKYLNASKEIIPQPILDKAPSAELSENQTDQDTLPPYEDLDMILRNYLEEHIAFDHPKTEWVITQLKKNEFKRYQMPLGLKISFKAFGLGRMIPIVKN